MHNFYLSPEQWAESPCLEGQEAHHAITVLRLAVGERIAVVDGQGKQGNFRITSIKNKKVFLEQESSAFIPRPLSLPIIALAFTKAIRRDFFMEKAAELGAHAVWIWQSDRSQGKVSGALASNLTRQMIAGIKQSGNPWLPQVKIFPEGVDALVSQLQEVEYRILPWELQDCNTMLTTSMLGRNGKTLYVIGPEGGFSERELLAFDNHSFSKVSLGARVLRCETAATLCLGLHWWASHLHRATQEKDTDNV